MGIRYGGELVGFDGLCGRRAEETGGVVVWMVECVGQLYGYG